MILLDEPTSHLDVKYKLEFLSLLREMARKKDLSVLMSLHELDLAERISDRVVCIKDGRMDRCGTPEQVFTPGYVEELFGMTAGRFDAAGGAVEFSVPGGAGRPEELPENAVFVIAGNGSGRQVFRKLQRENVPFVTGILFENDLDLPAAEAPGSPCGEGSPGTSAGGGCERGQGVDPAVPKGDLLPDGLWSMGEGKRRSV